MHITQVVGEDVHLHRVHMHIPFSYLENGWMNLSGIWCMVRDPLATRFTEVKGGVQLGAQLNVSMCARLCAGPSYIFLE